MKEKRRLVGTISMQAVENKQADHEALEENNRGQDYNNGDNGDPTINAHSSETDHDIAIANKQKWDDKASSGDKEERKKKKNGGTRTPLFVDDRRDVPNSTRSGQELNYHDVVSFKTSSENHDRSASLQYNASSSTPKHKHHDKRHRKRKHNQQFTTEASIRRVATDVVRHYFDAAAVTTEERWKSQSDFLHETLNQQDEVLHKLQEKLDDQAEWWKGVVANDSLKAAEQTANHLQQQKALTDLHQELAELRRQQQIQEAAFRQMEIVQDLEEQQEENRRLHSFLDRRQQQKVNDVLNNLNFTNFDSVSMFHQKNGSTNIFVFPRLGELRNRPVNNTSRLTLKERHDRFLSSRYISYVLSTTVNYIKYVLGSSPRKSVTIAMAQREGVR